MHIVKTPITDFVTAYTKVYMNYAKTNDYNWFTEEDVTITSGVKYHKLVVKGSAMAFINKANGDIFKPANWSSPAKHARGNINSEQNGMEAFDQHGFVHYLK